MITFHEVIAGTTAALGDRAPACKHCDGTRRCRCRVCTIWAGSLPAAVSGADKAPGRCGECWEAVERALTRAALRQQALAAVLPSVAGAPPNPEGVALARRLRVRDFEQQPAPARRAGRDAA